MKHLSKRMLVSALEHGPKAAAGGGGAVPVLRIRQLSREGPKPSPGSWQVRGGARIGSSGFRSPKPQCC